MSTTVRVFVNGSGLDAPAHGTALDAVRQHAAEAGEAVRAGAMLITDSRGLPIAADSTLYNGAVMRLVPNRTQDEADPARRFDE
jgi:hypothetical protein